ncbi:MAG: carboxypeptidase-like regulatory domain-containing protein [Alphaproteobacteria bacterium]|nr:carboxypeptidase-like regulatory domain-containing protein [Alphaproteobacteria bacterium]
MLLGSKLSAQNTSSTDSVVQLYGVVMSSDSLKGIPLTSVIVVGKGRGTISNFDGVFSIVVYKGDRIKFSCVGYKSEFVTIPLTLKDDNYSIVQLLVDDTVTLPATVLRPRPTREQFERDFVNNDVKDDLYEIARKNTQGLDQTLLYQNIPVDGGEAFSIVQLQNQARYYSNGQLPPQNIFNPLAWAEFIKGWKRGDYKRKKKTKY